MSGPYILDTNVVIYYVGGEIKTLGKLVPIMRSYAAVMLPSVVITELWSGKQTPSTEIDAIEAFIATLVVIPLEMQIAKFAGVLRRNHNLSIGDSIVAATALSMGATLLTRNTRDFKKVPNLLLEAV
ncbi:MAG: type II toxin-antitoxin system VapC family toxin [Candidatus Gottesmanbacteria bacterium]|nr:type II toxin-antitoxin system VapC family toxin [Candidatus Gottesmanbacteria bacterium]